MSAKEAGWEHRSYEAWTSAFDQAWRDPGQVRTMACPTCQSSSLHLVYVVAGELSEDGLYAFWCDHCLNGLPPGYGTVPTGARILGSTQRGEIPNYDTVDPDCR